jgi:hypothetical protein
MEGKYLRVMSFFFLIWHIIMKSLNIIYVFFYREVNPDPEICDTLARAIVSHFPMTKTDVGNVVFFVRLMHV